MNNFKVSIIIRTYNEEKFVGLLMDRLKSQDCFNDSVEIIVVDSGSTDKTLEIVRTHNVKLIEIPKADFTYSYALNTGIANSVGEFIVILSAHTIPADNRWLSGMIANFNGDKVAGVYCRQIPWQDAPCDEVIRIEKTFPQESQIFINGKTNNLSFSNAASCIKRQFW